MATNLERFLAGFDRYDQLLAWSLTDADAFWTAVWRFCGVRGERGWTRVRDEADGRWFPEAALNFAATVLRPKDEDVAIKCGERRWTHRALALETARVIRAFEAAGVRRGDRVASRMGVCAEAVTGLLAAAAMGAVWTEAPDDAALLAEAAPALLLATDEAPMEELRAYAAAVGSLRQVLVAPVRTRTPDLRGLRRALRWQDATALFQGCLDVAAPAYAFGQPLLMRVEDDRWVAYPAGGLLLVFLKELVLEMDVRPFTRVTLAGTGAADLVRGVTALSTGAVLDLTARNGGAAAALPASLKWADGATPALGVHVREGRVSAPCPSLPVDWRA